MAMRPGGAPLRWIMAMCSVPRLLVGSGERKCQIGVHAERFDARHGR